MALVSLLFQKCPRFLCSSILSQHPPKPLQLQNILLRQQTESKLVN